MRDRIDHWLLFAMVFVEALRGIVDICTHIMRLKAKAAEAIAKGNSAAARSWIHRAQEWAAFAVVCAVAVVPVLYYGAHATIA